MKIVHTESSLGWGGQEIRILREGELLAGIGHDVWLVCDNKSLIGQRVHDLAPNVKSLPIRLSKKRLKDLVQLRSVLTQIKPDVVVCHSSTDHWLCAVARKFLGHRFPIVRARHISAPVRKNLATKWLYSRGCEAITTTGKGIRDALVSGGICPSGKVESIPTGLDPKEFQGLSQQAAREMLGLSRSAILIGIVATLRSWKGHEDLIRAIALVDPKTQLIIVGEGPRLAALQALTLDLNLTDRVRFVGHQTDVAPWFASLDLYAQPSYANEGVPQAILQAMATGLPIVSCPIGGIPEAVTKYQAVRLVPIHDPDTLAGELERTIRELCALPSRDLLSHVPFTETSMAAQCEEFYEKVFDEYERS